MSELLNSLTRLLPNTQCVIGTVAFDGGTPSLTQLSGVAESDQAQVSIVDDATGVVTISVTNFRGPSGYLIGGSLGTTTISTFVSCTTQSYTANTDTANFTFKVENDASTATDAGFNFFLLAY